MKGVIRMEMENKLTKKLYQKMVIRDFMLGSKSSLIILALYAILWKVMYTITKIGQLKTNIPLFIGVSFLLVLVLIHIFVTYRRAMKKDFLFRAGSQIEINETQLVIQSNDSTDSHIFLLENLTIIKENKKWYFLYFRDKTFIPISKVANSSLRQVKKELKGSKYIHPVFWRWTVIFFLLITIGGVYYVGNNAVNFNGALSWKINELKTDTKIKLDNNNFYQTKLDGIMDSVNEKMELEPYLMTNDLKIEFEKDGTITSIYSYIYGFDKNKKLQSGYLLDYDKQKGNKITVHKQDWHGDGATIYDSDNDLSIVTNMLKSIPIADEVKQWNEENNAVLYKGIRSWGYNLEGIRFIDEKGEITIPLTAGTEIKGPTISLYIPGKENIIIPERYVFRDVGTNK